MFHAPMLHCSRNENAFCFDDEKKTTVPKMTMKRFYESETKQTQSICSFWFEPLIARFHCPSDFWSIESVASIYIIILYQVMRIESNFFYDLYVYSVFDINAIKSPKMLLNATFDFELFDDMRYRYTRRYTIEWIFAEIAECWLLTAFNHRKCYNLLISKRELCAKADIINTCHWYELWVAGCHHTVNTELNFDGDGNEQTFVVLWFYFPHINKVLTVRIMNVHHIMYQLVSESVNSEQSKH